MSLPTDEGGPAFPAEEYGCLGMTLRDYFAAKAMQEAMSWDGSLPESAAVVAYQYADAMLKARAA